MDFEYNVKFSAFCEYKYRIEYDICKGLQWEINNHLAQHRIQFFRGGAICTANQNLQLQEDNLKKANCYKIFQDVASGPKTDRPGLKKCLNYTREGDTLVVWKSDRLGRSTVDLLNIIDDLRKRNIGFKSLTEDLFDTTSSNGRLVFGIFALLAEHERD